MLKNLLFILSLTVAHINFSQYCTSGGPSSTIDSNVESVVLIGSSGSINYTGCPGVTGVQQILTQSTTLDAGSNYTADIQFGTCNNNYAGVGQAWIDFNQNMLFEASESIGTWQGIPPTALSSFNFTVPAGAVNGATRMRVIQYEGGSLPINPCAAFSWGSVMDFQIIIQGGVPTYCSCGPTTTADSNVESVFLIGNSSSINYSGCPGSLGLVLYAAGPVELGTNMNYILEVQFGTCGGNYAGAGEVWIDYNQNLVFETSESIGTWVGTPPTAISQFNFTVPPGTPLGDTKMRIMQHEAGSLPLDPCASFLWGSATDFELTIVPGVDCSSYAGDDQNDPIVIPSLPYTDNSSNALCYTNQNAYYPSADVFYLLTPPVGVQEITASLCGSSFDTYLTMTDKFGNILNSNDDYAPCGITSQLTTSVLGYDSVYIIVEGWGTTFGDYILNVYASDAGIGQMNLDLVTVFPNPATTVLNVKSPLAIEEIRLQDLQGKLVRELETDQTMHDISELPAGIYLVTIRSGGSETTRKLIKQ